MTKLTVHPTKSLRGNIRVPGDKSISHRALLCGALANGISYIKGFLNGNDCIATLNCLKAMGVYIEQQNDMLIVEGHGLNGLNPPKEQLNCIRSGTTMRLLCGLLAGQPFNSVLTGDEQLLKRPMKRVSEPLGLMGADIKTTNGFAPIEITGKPLKGIAYKMPVASAQVKSALLLAGLYAEGETIIHQPSLTRDHTERMLVQMGADIITDGLTVSIKPDPSLQPLSTDANHPYSIPGDFSSAAFPLVAGIITEDSDIVIEDVGINPTRTGLLDVLYEMGAQIEVIPKGDSQEGEPIADLKVKSSTLKGVTVQGEIIARMIDEFPIFAVAAARAQGVSIVRDAKELRVKETDRIATIVEELTSLGVDIEALDDGFIIKGGKPFRGAAVKSHGDHRVAMSLVVAGLSATQKIDIDDVHCISDSFPGFLMMMNKLGARYD